MISCEFKNGPILKKVNTHFGSIASSFIVRFSNQLVTMYTTSPCGTKTIIWRIPGDRINLKYNLPNKFVEFKLLVSSIKDTLKPVKKGDPVGFEITCEEDEYRLSIQIGQITSNRESSEFMHIDLSEGIQVNPKAFLPEHRRIFINCKEMEREISRLEKDSIRVIAFESALTFIGVSPGKHSIRTGNFGDMSDEEMTTAQDIISNRIDDCLHLGQVAPSIKTLCKIDDSPMHVNEHDGTLEFVSFPGCYGQLKLQIKCQDDNSIEAVSSAEGGSRRKR